MAITQAQIDALIQFIDETETAESVTNVIVAAIVRFLNDKIKHVEETQLTIEDLEEEAGERINADTTIQQNVDTLSNRINALLNNLANKTDKNSTTGRLEFSQAAPVVLKSMGQGEDGKLVSIGIGDVYYDDNQKIIKKKISASQSIPVGEPDQSIIYGNASNDKTYRWNGTKWVTVSGGDLGGEIQAIKNNMQTLLDALSNIAFDGDRPEFDWSDSGGGGGDTPTIYGVTRDLTDLESSNTQDSITKGSRLTMYLSIDSSLDYPNLYVIDDDSVVVTMNDIDITESAYDPSTGKIDIKKVTGDVEITASAITYVNTGLVLMLDGKNQGSVANQWANIKNPSYPLTISGTGFTKYSDHIEFDGGSSGGTMATGIIEDFGFNKLFSESTSEAVYSSINASSSRVNQMILITGRDAGTIIGTSSLNSTGEPCLFSETNEDNGPTPSSPCGLLTGDGEYSENQMVSVSHYGAAYKLNGKEISLGSSSKPCYIGKEGSAYNMAGRIAVGGFTSRNNAYTFPFSGNLYCIRLYSRALSSQEVLQNWKVDKKRFNIN